MSNGSGLTNWLERLERRAWPPGQDGFSPPGAVWRSALIVARGMFTDHIFERAGYMTYLTLLYMVPLVALMFALAEMLGWGRAALEFVVQRLSVTVPELSESLYSVITNLNFVTIGLAALLVIIAAGFVALNEFEHMVDDIWLKHRRRTLLRTLALYPLLVIGAPTVAALVMAIATVSKAQAQMVMAVLPQATRFGEFLYDTIYDLAVLLQFLPLILICMLLALIYYVVPSGRVRPRAAIGAGIVAGIAWNLAQSFYLNFQFATSTYRATWGYLAQIPLLLLWVYATWLIILAGVELTFAWQHRHTYLPKAPVDSLSSSARERAVVEIAQLLVAVTDSEPQGLTSAEVSNRLRIPWTLVRRHLLGMVAIGAVHSVRVRLEASYFAAGDLGKWTVGDLLSRWRESGEELPGRRPTHDHFRDDQTIAESSRPS